MNFAIMGRLSSQMKNMEMETHWYLKKQSGKYNDKSKSLDEWLNSAQNAQEIQEGASKGDDKLRAIHTKLFAGEELTLEEREYLKAKDPEAYRQLVAEEIIRGVHITVFTDGVHIDAQLLPFLVVADGAGAQTLGAGTGDRVFAGEAVAHRAGVAFAHAGPGLLQNFLISHCSFLLNRIAL